jgi:hypothetical protein
MRTCLSLCLAAIFSLPAGASADTTLVYELVDAAGKKTEQTYTIRGRFVRVDQGSDTPKNFLLLDGGFLYMNVVDGEKGTFTTFGESPFHQGERLPATAKAASEAEPTAEPAEQAAAQTSPKSTLSPTGKKRSIAGVRCREVMEMRNDKPVAEHCVADAAALGMTPRELITMARLIEFSKQRTDPDWIAMQSDEQFISIRSAPPGAAATFELKSVSHDIVPREYFRVPAGYKKLEPEHDYAGLITGSK